MNCVCISLNKAQHFSDTRHVPNMLIWIDFKLFFFFNNVNYMNCVLLHFFVQQCLGGFLKFACVRSISIWTVNQLLLAKYFYACISLLNCLQVFRLSQLQHIWCESGLTICWYFISNQAIISNSLSYSTILPRTPWQLQTSRWNGMRISYQHCCCARVSESFSMHDNHIVLRINTA